MNRPILIDLTINKETVYRFRAFHVPRVGETISSYQGDFQGVYEVVQVDHLLNELMSSFGLEKNYLQLVTIEVKQLTQK